MSKRSTKTHNRTARRAAGLSSADSRRQVEEPQAAPVLRRVSNAQAAPTQVEERELASVGAPAEGAATPAEGPAAPSVASISPAQAAPRSLKMPKRAEESAPDTLLAIFRDTLLEKKTALIRKFRRVRRRVRHVVREEKARRFPESDRAPVQLLLFARNMVPLLGTRFTEHKRGQRQQLASRFGLIRGKFEQKKIRPLPFLAATGTVALVILFFSIYTVGTTVTYNGEQIAAVESASAADSARTQLEKITSRAIGTKYTIDEKLLQYSSGLLPRSEVVDAAALEEDLSEEIGLVTYGYSLYVDGELIGATPYEGALDELLKQLKDGISDENTISCEFAENVEIKPGYVSTDQVMNLGYLAETLYSTKTAEVTYEVKSGDTWSEIANSHGLTSAELLALNPGYDINKLSIGEVLTLSASVPYLTMTVVEQERYLDAIPYDIEYTDSANLYKGDYKVISAGSNGSADVLANVTYVNGEEQERVILSSVTLKNPVTEQRLQGTKERPTWLPTGTFRWPCSGNITSRFGYRNLSYSYASTNHKGIDIANRYGTAIYAADGGTVTYAGWMSGYGYLVKINHGNGYETLYGHNSSLVASVGQHVYKGQQIARMGSTGNSTGNHCHFEVRYNGVPRNPVNYLP
ncbi:peptidoglycan DD-metalloendopeptidase family protein [Oscillibacter ruminantium]|uniref:peptidoglycan DD-metalloendopeptidase family protein n=1 Tax=Oscillibacter ruminantium TaxID=1263547 RepID=UPI002B1EC174|nr:peptidoglycan DD-metalloendopeptidase family protein [Oscillibacter ruminantium]MEA5041338.1 peptidoglycan DD-metalloendopeptidase family protein [Oscillibacter ruminantium]